MKTRDCHRSRKYGPEIGGRKRIMKKWVVYRGATLDPYKHNVKGPSAFEVLIYGTGGGGRPPDDSVFGYTFDEAMGKARRVVDVLRGEGD